MFIRILLIFFVVFAVIWWLRRDRVPLKNRRDTPRDGTKKRQPERMVECAHCRLHVPESECVCEDDRYYCCDEHRRLGIKR